jgi:hypothetical protein
MMTRFVLMLVLFFVLMGCAPQATDPSDAVERYLQAKVDGDEEVVSSLLCSAMESDLTRELGSFASVEATIEGMDCQRGEGDTVTCTGSINITYGTEVREFPLQSYNVVQEDGEWKWCGEAE